jgi:hypothetical protein
MFITLYYNALYYIIYIYIIDISQPCFWTSPSDEHSVGRSSGTESMVEIRVEVPEISLLRLWRGRHSPSWWIEMRPSCSWAACSWIWSKKNKKWPDFLSLAKVMNWMDVNGHESTELRDPSLHSNWKLQDGPPSGPVMLVCWPIHHYKTHENCSSIYHKP